LAGNLERWGVKNAAITNETPARLVSRLKGFFDRILVDAPCSGEGMFRRSEAARRDWSQALVATCAVRQTVILECAVNMLRPGGSLVYSTCTFNPHENEQVIRRLLDDFPEFEVVGIPQLSGTAPGRPDWAGSPASHLELANAVRLWPHQAPGEGHFAALLRKNPAHPSSRTDSTASTDTIRKDAFPSQVSQSYEEFCQQNLVPELIPSEFDRNRIHIEGTYLYLLPEELPDLSSLRVIHPGWWLGSFHAGKMHGISRFTPSHALAMGLNTSQARRSLDLEAGNTLTRAYLRGEMLPWEAEDGWVLVTVDGHSLGWGKAAGGRLKNYYPRGLRWL
jgi:NOL1/NOP2/fmu family ribosome biogenesis protein